MIIEPSRPSRVVFGLGGALDAFRAVRRLAGRDMGRVIPGHDPGGMRRNEAPRPELEGIVARLGWPRRAEGEERDE
jgi:hypothetical protein